MVLRCGEGSYANLARVGCLGEKLEGKEGWGCRDLVSGEKRNFLRIGSANSIIGSENSNS